MGKPARKHRPHAGWSVCGRLGVVLISTLALAGPSRGAPAPGAIFGAERTIELNEVRSGELLRKGPDGWVPLPVGETEVELSITGMMVHGRVIQRFHNPTSEVIEALYAFPLPEQAAVYRMEMTIGERRIVAVIQERVEARRTYEKARATGRKAALVEQERPNLFTTAAANINPAEAIEVVLEYFEELRYEQGSFRLRFPMTLTPRFSPPVPEDPSLAGHPRDPRRATDRPAAEALVSSVSVTVRLRPGLPLDRIESESHAVRIERQQDLYIVRPRSRRVAADRDFLLTWEPSLADSPRAAVFLEEARGQHYALLMLMPPIPGSEAGLGLPTETLFVVDVSGSMAGPSIEQARHALLAALDRLRPEDRFNLIAFNQEQRTMYGESRQATPDNLEPARDWVRDLNAGGGTMIYPALMRGLGMMGESRSSHARRIVFLTDGAVGNEQQVLTGIRERLGEVRLHTIGIGSAPNAYLMRKMALHGRGLCEFIANVGGAENLIDTFFERLDRPVMADFDLRWEGLEPDSLAPDRLRDLYAGQPLMVSARLGAPDDGGTVTLGGYTRAGWIETSARVDERAPRGSGVAVRWARARVEALTDSLHDGADEAMVRSEVLGLALDFHLVTRYTSLVAVDDRSSALGDARPVHVAGLLPQGGTDGPLLRRIGLGLTLTGLMLWVGVWVAGRPR